MGLLHASEAERAVVYILCRYPVGTTYRYLVVERNAAGSPDELPVLGSCPGGGASTSNISSGVSVLPPTNGG